MRCPYQPDARLLAEVGEWLHPFERYGRARMAELRDVLDDTEET